MTRKQILIAMYKAMDCRYDELDESNETLDQFLTELNPYIWADRMTADPAIQADFKEFVESRNFGDEIDPVDAYNLTKDFLAEKSVYYSEVFPDPKSIPFDELFEDISIDEWKKLCEIVEREESVES